MTRFLAAMILLSVPATLSADECTDTCDALYSQAQSECARVEQENLAVCDENHQIAELRCEADQLDCELMCLPAGFDPCDCTTPYLACLEQANLDLSACQQTVHAGRAVCDENALSQYSACLNGCGGCSIGTDHLVLDDMTVTDTQFFEACESITVGPNFSVAATGDATFRAPTIRILGATAVPAGGWADFENAVP
jgi:hypothetical protein